MRKKIITQLLCTALGVVVLLTPLVAQAADKTSQKTESSGQTTTAQAQAAQQGKESTSQEAAPENDMLTYQEAIQRGIRKSADYQNAEINQAQAVETNKDLVVYYDQYIPELWQAKDQAKLAETWSNKYLDIVKQITANNIRNQMDDISLQLLEKQNLQDQIALKKEVLKNSQVRYGNGMISRLELSGAEVDLKSMEQDLATLEKQLEGSYITLYGALDLPVDTNRKLEYSVKFAEEGPVDLDWKYTQALDTDPFVWQKEQLIETAQYKLDTYQYNRGGKNYTLTKLDVTQAKQSADNTKNSLKLAIKTRYNSLQQIEESLKSLDLKEEQAKLALTGAEAKFQAGMGIALDVKQARQTLENLQLERTKAQQKYMQTKAVFDTLYLKPDYSV